MWSPDQESALAAVGHWLRERDRDQLFRLFGYAGTGKTELAREIGYSRSGVHFAAFTGKAAHVLQQRGCEPVSTIHKLIYNTEYIPGTGWYRYLKEPDELGAIGLFIIDECSMVDEDLARDLMSFDIPILVIGDPGQLPPINGAGYFMGAEPDAMLEEIHRQARESAILRLADSVRRGEPLPKRGFKDGGVTVTDPCIDDLEAYDVVLAGTNDTRWDWNTRRRRKFGFNHRGPPQTGEIIICLRNDYYHVDGDPVFNGSLWRIKDVELTTAKRIPIAALTIADQYNGRSTVKVPLECFKNGDPPPPHSELQHFDFGYALTAHKAQGSEWKNILLIDEGRAFAGDARRWRYTAITRAKETLRIVV
jgi:ATP-dependent exoDNAse (exonuclease V) alpha subunit